MTEEGRALESSKSWSQLGVVPCTVLMNSFLRTSQWYQAIYIFELLRNRRCFDTISLNVALKALAQGQQWKNALDCLAKVGDQVQTDIITYTAAIRACEGDQWQQAVGVFCLLLQSALEADEMSYSALLSGTPAPRWQHAVSLLQKSRPLGLLESTILPSSPCLNVLNVLLNLCGQEWRFVVFMFQLVALSIADRITCNIAMRAAGASFNWQSSISFLSLMELRRIAKNTISCNTVMNACSSAVKWEHSLLLAAAVPHSRLHADVVTPSLAISAHAVFGRWQDVLVVIEESFRTSQGVDGPAQAVDAVACNAALMACDERKLSEEWQNGQNGQNGQNWQMVLELLHDLHGRQVQRNIMTYSTAIRSCGKGSAWHISMELFQEALLWRVEADAMAVNVLITALGRGDQWPRALQMLAAGNTDVIAYNALMSSLERSSEWQVAGLLFSELDAGRMKLDALPYMTAIGAFSEGQQWQQTLDILRKFMGSNLQLQAAQPLFQSSMRPSLPVPKECNGSGLSNSLTTCKAFRQMPSQPQPVRQRLQLRRNGSTP